MKIFNRKKRKREGFETKQKHYEPCPKCGQLTEWDESNNMPILRCCNLNCGYTGTLECVNDLKKKKVRQTCNFNYMIGNTVYCGISKIHKESSVLNRILFHQDICPRWDDCILFQIYKELKKKN